MDVNGTRFHFFREKEDWLRLRDPDQAAHPPVQWYADRDGITLTRQVFRFGAPPAASSDDRVLLPEVRRGAASDPDGSIYWIDESGRRVMRRTRDGDTELYWDVAAALAQAADTGGATGPGGFRPSTPNPPPTVDLRGLAVTGHYYLVVGNPPGHELLVLDLRAGGPALHLAWPPDVPFHPWDLDSAPDDGVWVLDRAHRRLWRVDRTFQVAVDGAPGAPPPGPSAGGFDPEHSSAPRPVPRAFPLGTELPTASPPVAVAGLPDGTVIILESPDASGQPSTVTRLRGDLVLNQLVFADVVPIAGEGDRRSSVHAYDMAFVPVGPVGNGTLVLVESSGNQAFAWHIDWSDVPPLPDPADYLPLRRYGGAELTTRDGRVLYDFRDRWVEIRPISRPRYARFGRVEGPSDEPLDGRESECVWHRVALDGCIPPETSVTVFARADDDPEGVELLPWIGHDLYARGDGSELPFHEACEDTCADGEGTWETLLQGVEGRYMEIALELRGTGRATPVVRGLRVHYPRFSYLHRYLPEVYREEPESAAFGDRLLANFEGLLTTWEGRIVEAHRFFDPSAAPAEALEWLAGWLGVVLDPLWDAPRRRLFLRYAAELYRWRGTALGIEVAVRLFLDAAPGNELFDGQRRPRSPVRVVERFQTRRFGRGYQGPDSGAEDVLAPLTQALVRAHAHRFVVLVPSGLDEATVETVRRIVELEKPAHTTFDLDLHWALFRVGWARLGLDTDLGEGSRFRPGILGADLTVGAVHLTEDHPFGVRDRIVPGRDVYGCVPPL